MSESGNQYQKVLSHQYEMMKRGEYCDFSIVVEGKIFHVHKLVLGTRSPYFETLFSTEMMETAEKKLELYDINVEVFEIFLKYLYTFQISDLEKYAEKLMLCGEKYHMEELVELCELSLLKTLNVENSACCLLLGHLLDRQNLKTHSLLFVRENWNAVLNTDGWKNVISHHALMNEMGSKLFSEVTNITPTGAISTSDRTRTWIFKYDAYQVRELYYIQSPTFSLSDGENSTSWKFTAQLEDKKMTLSLVHIGMHVPVPPIMCSFAINRSNPSQISSGAVETTCCFDVKSVCRKPLIRWSVDDQRYREKEICFQLRISNWNSNASFQQPLINYFHEYLENSCFTDAIIDLKSETFSIHKIILSAASPVFAELFKTPKKRYILEEDVDPQTFKEMLALIYRSGEDLKSADLSLLRAADRFRLNEKLKNRCREAILEKMNNENTMDVLIYSETSDDTILKQVVLKYICKNFFTISKLPCWEIMKHHPQLHSDLLCFLKSRLRDFS